MEKKSLKLLSWTKKDIALVAITYFANIVLLALFLVAIIRINSGRNGITEYFASGGSFANFIILLVLFIVVMFLYIYFEDRNFLKKASNSEMLFLILEVCLILCNVVSQYVNIFLRPLSLAAMLILFLTNTRTAMFFNFIFSIIMFLFDSFACVTMGLPKYSAVLFFAMSISSGAIAIYLLKGVYSRMKLFLYSFITSLPAALCVIVSVIDLGVDSDSWLSLVCSAASGPVAAVLFFALLPFFESLFKKASFFKYAELTDHKSKFIRRLITQAPGTFNHAIVVSNIAEACATAIEEDALLARTCAYYHDVGKLRRPEFFKENQADGLNPHDDLTPELSANIIKAHTTDGYQLVAKNRLPQIIADVCAQHHGTLPILYFYGKAQKFTDGEVPITQYCYPGPKPQTKIAAIIMIADGCEAAVRVLKDRSRENVYNVVKKIVSDRMAWGQFEECEITLKELSIIINTVVNSLTGVYHSRIEYPKISFEGMEGEDSSATVAVENKEETKEKD